MKMTELRLSILDVLWDIGGATISTIIRRMGGSPKDVSMHRFASSNLTKMIKAGLVEAHGVRPRTYTATKSREELAALELSDFVSRYHKGDLHAHLVFVQGLLSGRPDESLDTDPSDGSDTGQSGTGRCSIRS